MPRRMYKTKTAVSLTLIGRSRPITIRFEYSVMTYRFYPGAPTEGFDAVDYPTTPMQDDILALQYLYGPNYDYHSGKTTYRWSPATGQTFINGVSQGVPLHTKIFLTIWDGGGIDTYDFSNYTTDAVIDLRPGAWSSRHQRKGRTSTLAIPTGIWRAAASPMRGISG